MFKDLNDNLKRIIYECDNTYKDTFNKCMLEFEENNCTLEYKINLQIQGLDYIITLWCMRWETIKDIIEHIINIYRINEHIILETQHITAIYKGVILEHDKTLSDYKIKNNSCITFNINRNIYNINL